MGERLDLQGVPETLLWPLYNRGSFARQADAQLRDPEAVRILDAIDYPFARNFGAPDESHALRALRFDEAVKAFLAQHPDGTVVALGEGLQTTFSRCDNGRCKWLAVDLPETIAVRRRFISDGERHRSLACSALDLRWMDEVDTSKAVFVTAEGLLMYLPPDEVRRLIGACAARFRGGGMMFDTIPKWFSKMTTSEKGFWKTKAWRAPPMPFGLDLDEQQGLKALHPNIAAVEDVDIGRGKSFAFRVVVPLFDKLPLPGFIANKRPAFVKIRFGA